MGSADYIADLSSGDAGVALRTERLGDTSWDPALHDAMGRHGAAVYEEALLEALLGDICNGAPASTAAVCDNP